MSQSLGYGVSVLGIEKHVVAGGRCAEVSHCHTAALPPCLGVSCLPARKIGSAFCICAQRVGKKKKKLVPGLLLPWSSFDHFEPGFVLPVLAGSHVPHGEPLKI